MKIADFMACVDADDFWQRVERRAHDDCWLYQGARTKHGYGNVARHLHGKRRNVNASRVAAWLAHGPFTDDLHVCHRCDNPPCCNPAHLFVASQSGNMRDSVDKGRHRWKVRPLYCAKGHWIAGDNVYVSNDGARRCRECNIAAQRRLRARSDR